VGSENGREIVRWTESRKAWKAGTQAGRKPGDVLAFQLRKRENRVVLIKLVSTYMFALPCEPRVGRLGRGRLNWMVVIPRDATNLSNSPMPNQDGFLPD
jgi:hypothetical protein